MVVGGFEEGVDCGSLVGFELFSGDEGRGWVGHFVSRSCGFGAPRERSRRGSRFRVFEDGFDAAESGTGAPLVVRSHRVAVVFLGELVRPDRRVEDVDCCNEDGVTCRK